MAQPLVNLSAARQPSAFEAALGVQLVAAIGTGSHHHYIFVIAIVFDCFRHAIAW
jgi:hypothetical protein